MYCQDCFRSRKKDSGGGRPEARLSALTEGNILREWRPPGTTGESGLKWLIRHNFREGCSISDE